MQCKFYIITQKIEKAIGHIRQVMPNPLNLFSQVPSTKTLVQAKIEKLVQKKHTYTNKHRTRELIQDHLKTAIQRQRHHQSWCLPVQESHGVTLLSPPPNYTMDLLEFSCTSSCIQMDLLSPFNLKTPNVLVSPLVML